MKQAIAVAARLGAKTCLSLNIESNEDHTNNIIESPWIALFSSLSNKIIGTGPDQAMVNKKHEEQKRNNFHEETVWKKNRT